MKLLIVDDHPVMREGLAALLQQAAPGTVVLQARDSAEGLDAADAHGDLDAVFLDLALPGMGGLPAIREFGRRRPDLPVIVISSSEDPEDVRQALARGALGYVPKSANPQTVLSALQLVLSGEVYVPPLMLNLTAGGPATAGTARGADPRDQLTERQIEVLKLVCRGLSNKEISRTLDISDKTVKAHITMIFRVLNVVNRTQAANAARRAQLIPDER